MSLFCGACRHEIFKGFGLLYRLPFRNGVVTLPSQGFDPPNSSVCDECWARVPESLRLSIGQVGSVTPEEKTSVFAYAKADSGTSQIWGSKQWSSIEEERVSCYLEDKTATLHLSQAISIIVQQLPT